MNPPPAPPSGAWPDGLAATSYLARVESLLKARGLNGTDPQFKPLIRRIAAAFQARDMAAVTAACDALVDAIEERPPRAGRSECGTTGPREPV